MNRSFAVTPAFHLALLATTKLPVAEIAVAVGYSDSSYFARLFRREVGLTPLRYRQERQT